MNLSTGINLEKELNAIMRRVKKPKIHDKEECIFCCDDNYDDGYDYKNHEVYDLEDEDENENNEEDNDNNNKKEDDDNNEEPKQNLMGSFFNAILK